jgi:outer membrane murein-binding lipoprotein Lpp
MKNRISVTIMAFLIAAMILSACSTSTQIDPSAQTAVAQTLDAIVQLSQTPVNTATEKATATQIPPTATATATIVPTPVVEASGPNNFPANVNPLTGLTVEDVDLLDRRPVMVKVANYPAVGRPHAGLSFADIVFEYYIGAGVNRFMGLYYGQNSEKIGPVRSGRFVDPQIVSMYQGILGFWSADERVYSRILEVLGNRAITGSENTCPGFCDDGRNIVTSKFGDSAALSQIAEQRGVTNSKPNLDGMRFDPAVPAEGEPGEDVVVSFGSINQGEWKYDQTSGKYLRWIEETDAANNLTMIPLVDSITDEQLAFSNVIILYAYYTEYSPTLHDISVWDNTSGRPAVVFRNGQAYDVIWKAASMQSPIQFTYPNGEMFPLNPGNSWMVFMGSYSEDKVADGIWTFTNYLP